MALYKLEEFAANYGDADFDNYDVRNWDVYSNIDDDKVGSVKHTLVDDSGHFRYLVVDTGFWFFGREVLLPIGRSRIDYRDRRVYAIGLTKEQVENLPDFHDLETIDYDYEERVRGVYRTPTTSATKETPVGRDRSSYTYDHEPNLYAINQQDHQNLKLYEERLVTNKSRVKTGEVSVGKHTETDTARVAVPVEKERVVIERTTPTAKDKTVSPGEANFSEGEVARMEVYEETPDIRKEAVVREEVKVKKVTEQETVEAQDTVRREELDIDRNV